MLTWRILYGLVLLSLAIGCNEGVGKSNEIPKDTLSHSENETAVPQTKKEPAYLNSEDSVKQTLFKKWVNDTLVVLHKSQWNSTSRTRGIIFHEAIVASDSLALSIKIVRDIPSNSAEMFSADVQRLLDVLKEHKEPLRIPCRVKFETHYFFTPSPVSHLVYDSFVDLDDVKISERNGRLVKAYEIVRGRISSKQVFITKQNGAIQELSYDFIWMGNNLKKVKVK